MKYRICYKSKITNASGQGQLIEKTSAIAWLKVAQSQYPEIDHWIEDEDGNKVEVQNE